MKVLMAAQSDRANALTAAMSPAVGCKSLNGTVEGKTFKGVGNNCAGTQKSFDQVPFNGVIR